MSQWERVQTNTQEMERIWSVPRTFAGDVWFRFRKKPTALAGFLIVVLLLCFALLGPFFSPYSYSDQSLALANIPPHFERHRRAKRQLPVCHSRA